MADPVAFRTQMANRDAPVDPAAPRVQHGNPVSEKAQNDLEAEERQRRTDESVDENAPASTDGALHASRDLRSVELGAPPLECRQSRG